MIVFRNPHMGRHCRQPLPRNLNFQFSSYKELDFCNNLSELGSGYFPSRAFDEPLESVNI